jgi:hypothetical protein
MQRETIGASTTLLCPALNHSYRPRKQIFGHMRALLKKSGNKMSCPYGYPDHLLCRELDQGTIFNTIGCSSPS